MKVGQIKNRSDVTLDLETQETSRLEDIGRPGRYIKVVFEVKSVLRKLMSTRGRKINRLMNLKFD